MTYGLWSCVRKMSVVLLAFLYAAINSFHLSSFKLIQAHSSKFNIPGYFYFACNPAELLHKGSYYLNKWYKGFPT